MKQLFKLWLATIITLSIIHTAVAEDASMKQAQDAVKKIIPGIKPDAVKPSPINGLYQVTVPPEMFYISADGRYAFSGDIIDLNNGKNVSTPVRDQMRIMAVNEMGEDSMIIYGPKTSKHTVTVFTDIDCGYCRKLHGEMAQYNKAGIRVRYLAYPRAGVPSESYNKAVAVWCAKDKNAAMTQAKKGEQVKMAKCDNPVASQYELGQSIGLRGTPAIITEDGMMIPGYVPPDKLVRMLDAKRALK